MIKDISKRPLYAEINGDKCRIMQDGTAFIRLDGGKEFETKAEVGNNTLFDILHGNEISEKEYSA